MIISIASNLLNNNNLYKKHSTFNSTVNFIDSNNNLIAVHPFYIEKSPLAIIFNLDKESFDKYFKNINYLQIIDNVLYLDNYKFNLDNVLKTNHSLLNNQNDNLNLKEMLTHLDNIINNNDKNIKVDSILKNKINNLLINFGNGSTKEAVSNLIGYGEGLTPSGDDILAGTLAGLLLSSNINAFNYLKTVVNDCLVESDTTIFSKAFLKYAFEGLFILNVINLVNDRNTKDVLVNISNMGHRSGIDYLIGIKIGILKGGKI